MENDSQKEGLVGIFDILGYQYIIDTDKINDAADLISNTLLTLPQNKADELRAYFKDGREADYYYLTKENLKWRIFSDTILLSFTFTLKEHPDFASMDYKFFLHYVSLLLRSAFDAGLPLRGAIDYGKFYIKENCFAGKPIINSYRLSQKLQLSGCAMTKELQEFLTDIESAEALKQVEFPFVLPYLVPLKENIPEKLRLINWLCPLPDWKITCDLRQYVAEKFYAHNKDIPREALPKLENTEMTLRYFLSKREQPPG